MASTAKKHFDVLEFVKTSKALGVKEELAEYQARQFEQVIDIASENTKKEFNVRELATKADIIQLESATKADIMRLESATKADIMRLESATRADIHELRTELKSDMQELKTELKSDITQLDIKIERNRFDTLKFVVWTGVGVVMTLSGLLAKGFHWI